MTRVAPGLAALALILVLAPAALAKPDLVVQSIVLDPAGAGAGDGTLTAKIKNVGPDDTSFFVNINILMYRDGVECDDGLIVAGLDAGDTATEDSTSCNPSKPGTYAITFAVDTDQDVDESNESNNSLTVNITWSGPDLVITKIELSPNPAAFGEGTLTATIKNQGPVDTDTLLSINVTMELDGKPCDDGLILLGLDSGQSATEETGSCNPDTPGPHTVTFKVDTDDDVAELDEGNNTLSQTFTWYAPDLVVTDVVLEPDPAKVGEGTLIATIENQGLIDTDTLLAINVRMLLDGNECDTGLIIAGLDAGDSATEETTSCNPGTDGPHEITFIVDTDSDVVEMDESNNTFTKTLSWHLPDLVVSDIVVDSEAPLPGESHTFTATIENQGVVDTDTLVIINLRMLLDGVECDTGLIFAGLDAGESATEDTTSCTPDTPGPHTVTFEVDVDGDVPEGDETNNSLTKTFTFCGKSETCDGTDDDCDGKTDEDFALGGACDGPDDDLCETGVVSCGADKKSVVCVETPGVGELCNGQDDDCDGATDESWAELGTSCDGPDADTCATGKWACGPDGLSLMCAGDGAPGSELCNGLDDDCNGETDESWPELGQPCTASVGGCEAAGTVACQPDGSGTLCEPSATPVETCDGTDDDCDGKTDEGFSGLGAPCLVGTGACQAIGVYACKDAATVGCDAVAGAPAASDECGDGVDGDCDGKTDEGCGCEPGTHVACGTDVGACVAGVQTCGAGGTLGTSCVGETPAVVETCDGLDNDCDASIDEGCPCTVGQVRDCEDEGGECAAGKQQCAGGTWTPCMGAGVLEAEACNGVDDDCDGATDEGCPCVVGLTEGCATPAGSCGLYARVCGTGAVFGACALIPGTEEEGCVDPNGDAGTDIGGPDAGGTPDAAVVPDTAADSGPGADVGVAVTSTSSGCGGAPAGAGAGLGLIIALFSLIGYALFWRRRRRG
ncbi:MAG: hypothetical protein H6744_21240 [Deltaproteobacteria bacterium]|nr:hypothetical protein [Deltaproteobacteria bacterium]